MILDSPEPLWIAWGRDNKAFFFNDAYLPMLGGKLHGAMGSRLEDVWADVWADVVDAINDAFGGTSRSFKNMPLMMDRDGTLRETFWTFSYSPLRAGCGGVAGIICMVSEQTERVIERDRHTRQVAAITEQAREAHLELVRAREQLRQSQKLEAIGQLTGGVAHDFNNLLQVITGSVDMLLHTWPAEDARLRYVQAIETAADRATRLTAQLLAFSRRQSLSPQVFDLCESIRALSDIITTVLGARISVSVNLPDAPLPVLLDRTQLDTALINIAVNARDAIDGHGKVTIDVEQLTSVPSVRFAAPMKGNFAAISVSDTGAGIDPSVVDRIFEPFFTTKGVGAGTGLASARCSASSSSPRAKWTYRARPVSVRASRCICRWRRQTPPSSCRPRNRDCCMVTDCACWWWKTMWMWPNLQSVRCASLSTTSYSRAMPTKHWRSSSATLRVSTWCSATWSCPGPMGWIWPAPSAAACPIFRSFSPVATANCWPAIQATVSRCCASPTH